MHLKVPFRYTGPLGTEDLYVIIYVLLSQTRTKGLNVPLCRILRGCFDVLKVRKRNLIVFQKRKFGWNCANISFKNIVKMLNNTHTLVVIKGKLYSQNRLLSQGYNKKIKNKKNMLYWSTKSRDSGLWTKLASN